MNTASLRHIKTENKILGASILLGVWVWIIDALIHARFISEKSFWKLLVTDFSFHEIYHRLIVILWFLLFGAVMIQVVRRRKKAEQEVRRQKEFSERLLEIANAVVLVLDEQANIVTFNTFAEKLTGYRKDEVLGKNWFELFIPGRYRNGIPKVFQDVLSQLPEASSHENPLLCKDGTERTIEWKNTLLKGDGNRPAGVLSIGLDRTEQKQTEETRRENEKLLKAIAENYPNSYLSIIEKDLTIGFTSGREFKKQHLDPNQFVGIPLEQVFGDKAETVKNYYLETFKGREQSFELFINDQYQLYRTVPLPADDGTIPRILAVVENITERRQAEEKLRRSEERFRRIYEGLLDAVILADPETRQFVDCNDQALFLTGYDREELLKLKADDLHPPEVLERTMDAFRRQSEGERLIIESEIRTKDGVSVPVTINSHTVFLRGKTFLVGVFRDMSELKRAEETVRTSEAKLRNIVEHSTNLFYSHDANQVLTYLSPQVEEILGYEPREAMIKWTELATDNPVNERGLEITRKAIDTGQAQETYELELRHKSGRPVWLEIREAPVVENGKTIAIVGAATDITDRRTAEDQLRHYSEMLEEKVEERTKSLREVQEQLVRKERLAVLGQLAGSVAHELRNPLGVISNAVFFLRSVLPKADETTSEYLGIITSEIKNSESIVSDLLDFSRIGAAVKSYEDFAGLVDEVVARAAIPGTVHIQRDYASDLPAARIDAMQIRRVIDNLVTNACQAMPEGGTVSIGIRPDTEKIVFTVTDTGVGIPAANLTKIFEPLFTTKARGIGLGLALSKYFVEANGGTIEVESEEGKGSMFTVTLPIKE